VWPFPTVRVVFPNGQTFEKAPVLYWDLKVDMAIIGPVETDLQPLDPIDGESFVVGGEALLIGYPGETGRNPQPSLSKGVISRKREWRQEGITFFQADIPVVAAEQGGVLISDKGKVIGMLGYLFADAQFSLIPSAVDLLPRASHLLSGKSVDELGRGPAMFTEGERSESGLVAIGDGWDQEMFVIWEKPGTKVNAQLLLDEKVDLKFFVRDVNGAIIPLNKEGAVLVSEGEFTTSIDAPYFLVVVAGDPKATGSSMLKANVPMLRFNDPDDDHTYKKGQSLTGGIDFPGDMDVIKVLLDKDETIHIRAESVMIDSVAYLDLGLFPPLQLNEPLAVDDNSGGGVFGLDAEFSYQAPFHGVYKIIVGDNGLGNIGGYTVTLDEPGDSAPTPIVPTPTPTPLTTSFGEMRIYESSGPRPYRLPYPASMTPMPLDDKDCYPQVAACFALAPLASLNIFEADPNVALISLEHEELVTYFEQQLVGLELAIDEKKTFKNANDLKITLLSIRDDALRIWYIIHGDDDGAFIAIFTGLDYDRLPDFQKKLLVRLFTRNSFMYRLDDTVRYMAEHLDIAH